MNKNNKKLVELDWVLAETTDSAKAHAMLEKIGKLFEAYPESNLYLLISGHPATTYKIIARHRGLEKDFLANPESFLLEEIPELEK